MSYVNFRFSSLFKPQRNLQSLYLIDKSEEETKEPFHSLVYSLKLVAIKGIGKVRKSVGKFLLSSGDYRKFE